MAQKQFIRFGSQVATPKRIQLSKTIFISEKQHQDLLVFLQERLRAASEFRNPLVDKFVEIDKDVSGFIVPSKEDRVRIRDNMLGKAPKMVDENIQFALMQMDEAVTFMLGVIVATPGMYQAITIADKQKIANGFASVMNDHARQFKHYRALAKALLDMFKFNLGGHLIDWFTEKGPKIKGNTPTGDANISLDEYLRVGNRLTPIDPYNFLWDPSVSPIDIGTDGEFFAMIDTIRPFKLRQQESAGEMFQLDRIGTNQTQMNRYYRQKPMLQNYYSQAGGRTDWDSYWTGKWGNDTTFDPEALERAAIYTWIVPSDYGLSSSAKPQIWKFDLINDAYVMAARQQISVHNRLPVAIGQPNEDGLKLQSRTFAEMLLPFQRFATAQLNMHQKAMRKRLYGITIYNRRVIPLLENEMLEGGKIAANPTGTGEVNLNNQIIQLNDAPETTKTMEDVAGVLGLMQKMLPSTQANQVADLDRATRYQAAALIQATNRRNQKLAKLIDDQCLDDTRRMMMLNVMQFQPAVEVVDDATGSIIQINPAEFREIKIEFAIADGMRGLDKLLITDSLREVINMLLQSQVVNNFDIAGIINYYLEMQGDKLDFMQFKYKSEMDKLPPKMRDMAFQLLQSQLQQLAQEKPDEYKQLMAQLQETEAPGTALGHFPLGKTDGAGA